MTYWEALDRVISAAIFYYVADLRSQPDLRMALDIVIRQADKDIPAVGANTDRVLTAWLQSDAGPEGVQ